MNKKDLGLAPAGICFDAENHKYSLNGKELSGITGVIAKRLHVRMPKEFVGEAQAEGVHIHGAVEKWLKTGEWDSVHPMALFVRKLLEQAYEDPLKQCHSEVLVSDRKKYASMVDIIGVSESGLCLYDIKRSFSRVYVTWQLSVYKYFIEKYSKYRVVKCACIAVRDKTLYPVFPYAEADVKGLLYGGDE